MRKLTYLYKFKLIHKYLLLTSSYIDCIPLEIRNVNFTYIRKINNILNIAVISMQLSFNAVWHVYVLYKFDLNKA